MSLMDNARELKEYQDRARTLSDYELVSKLRNRDYSGVIERAALEQEHRYRTGQDTRSDGPCYYNGCLRQFRQGRRLLRVDGV